jgi:diguanylate cyclase (GGDEF)-like protein
MRLPTPTLPPGVPDPKWLRRLLYVQRILLALAGIISITALCAWIFPQMGAHLPGVITHLSVPMALTVMFCVLSLVMSEAGNPPPIVRSSRYVALVAAVIAVAVLVNAFLGGDQADSIAGRLSAAAFIFLSLVIILVESGAPYLRSPGDSLVSCLCLFTIILISQDLFGALGLFGLASVDLIAPQVLCCMVLLTTVVLLRQVEHGVLSIFVGTGIGSRIARGFAPFLLLWPFVHEIGESQIISHQLIPAHFAPSILTSVAAAAALILLLFIVWRINDMEKEIHDLTLRDELTGLYNMRGFYLLGEQTLRLAQRAQLPFSVLFLDLDGLKQINDQLGHNAGSGYLVETGELIFANFREADVKGRFGGDEFVVAGQFSRVGIEIAAQRLKNTAAEISAAAGRKYPLSLSIGYVTSEHYSTETLAELVARADQAMYEDKRSKKVPRNKPGATALRR